MLIIVIVVLEGTKGPGIPFGSATELSDTEPSLAASQGRHEKEAELHAKLDIEPRYSTLHLGISSNILTIVSDALPSEVFPSCKVLFVLL